MQESATRTYPMRNGRAAALAVGKAFIAVRDNPIRAESLGTHVQAYTLLAFAVGAAYAGIAGALFASLVQFIEPRRASGSRATASLERLFLG